MNLPLLFPADALKKAKARTAYSVAPSDGGLPEGLMKTRECISLRMPAASQRPAQLRPTLHFSTPTAPVFPFPTPN